MISSSTPLLLLGFVGCRHVGRLMRFCLQLFTFPFATTPSSINVVADRASHATLARSCSAAVNVIFCPS
ncbi:uncharacterized protein DS421_1g21720 [Arachis hypogaea]|nr:uncharacterized protein DS421_1g21720 [Arachis hypogaea]